MINWTTKKQQDWPTHLSQAEKEYQLAKEKVGYLNKDLWFEEGQWTKADVNYYFSHDYKKPSKEEVDKAMIWQTSNGHIRVGYKAGGGSLSDSIYSSSLSVKLDSGGWTVIAKKYSLEFKDVLLDENEIDEAMLDVAGDREIKEHIKSQIGGACYFFLRGQRKQDVRDMIKTQASDFGEETYCQIAKQEIDSWLDRPAAVKESGIENLKQLKQFVIGLSNGC